MDIVSFLDTFKSVFLGVIAIGIIFTSIIKIIKKRKN
jgi:hypothetical protein